MGSYTGKSAAEKAIRGLTRNSIRDGEVVGKKLHDDVLSGRYYKYLPGLNPFLFLADGSGLASGLDTIQHLAMLPGIGSWIYYVPIGDATVIGPRADVRGLLISLDATVAEGCNYIVTPSQGQMVVDASDPLGKGMFVRARFVIDDVSGCADLAVGFRKNEVTQADDEDYDELAAINVQLGTVASETILNGGAAAIVDSTLAWADGEEHEIEVRVSPTGVVTLRFDGADLPVGQPFTFDDAEQLIPFIYVLNEAASTSEVFLTLLEVGTLEQV